MNALGRIAPPDWEHVGKFPLSDLSTPPTSVPVAIGVNWYQNFDQPILHPDGSYWIGAGNLDAVRGGHCVCLEPAATTEHDLAQRWWSFYDQGQEGACFPAGTLVEMADGELRSIDQIRTLDRVRTAEGNEGVVLQTSARLHTKGLIRLRLRGHGHLRATAEHPILTRGGYVALGDLRIGDEVRLPARAGGVVEVLRVSEWLTESEQRVTTTGARWAGVAGRAAATSTITAAPATIPLSPALGRIVGLWLAEGGTTANKVVWTFGGHERDTLAAELMGLLRECLDVEPRLQVRGSGALNVVVYGKHWRMLFERLLSRGPYEKNLPGVLADGPADFLSAVLYGWLAGDGHRRRNRWSGVTVSHTLAMGMYRIAQGLGLSPTIRWAPGKPNAAAATRRGRWDVEFSEGQQAGVDDGGSWRKVTGLEHEDWAGHVFNLEVEGDHSYVVEGVGVHNCEGFGHSRMQSLTHRQTFDAFWLYHQAQAIDGIAGAHEGTTNRAALEILRTKGHVLATGAVDVDRGDAKTADPRWGIKAYRWATSADDILAALGTPTLDYVTVLNSWGKQDYPHRVRMPASVLDRLLREGGEAGVATES